MKWVKLVSEAPMDVNGAPYELNWQCKIFEGNNMATLEGQINTWLATEPTVQGRDLFLGPPVFLGTQANNSRLMLPYGFYTPQ